MKKILWIALSGLLISSMGTQYALAGSNDWQIKADTQGSYGQYSGSIKRKSLSNAGIIISADYLEKAGFSVGGNYTKLSFRRGNVLDQQAFYANARYHFYPDALAGVVSVRLDGHLISNKDRFGNTDNVQVLAPQVSFLNYAKTFYLDLGYARSNYKRNFSIDQLTPTLGFGFNEGFDWLQLRAYLIKPSDKRQAQNTSQTSALDLKWTHWLTPATAYGLEKIQLASLFGDRIYAVDGDAAAVYNLADVQKGSLSLAVQWRIAKPLHMMLMAGNERYLDKTINNSYNNRFVYIDFTTQW